MCFIFLVTNIIITLNVINYFTKTFITDTWHDRKSVSTFKKTKSISFKFPWIIHQSNNLGVLVILEWQKKNRKETKYEIDNRNTDLPCWRPRICWKTLFQLCYSKVETKNKISTCYSKNIDRILTRLDKLRSNLPQSILKPRLNLKIIFQNSWHNLTNPIFCQFTVNMYHQLTDPSQPPLIDVCVKVCQLKKLDCWNKEKPLN